MVSLVRPATIIAHEMEDDIKTSGMPSLAHVRGVCAARYGLQYSPSGINRLAKMVAYRIWQRFGTRPE
jgi:hypothetical protein